MRRPRIKTRISIGQRVLLTGLLAAASTGLVAQTQSAPGRFVDVAVTYAAERTQIAPGNCGCFWLQGGGADAAFTFWKGFGVAASITGAHASNYFDGFDVNKIAYMGGPHYAYTFWRGPAQPRLQIFGEALFGEAHAFDGAFPSRAGITASANSFALQTGGGINLFLSRSIGLRVLQADYVRTQLPNDYSKSQNDLRLAFGVNFHFGSAAAGR